MWGTGPDDRLRRSASNAPANQWHTVGDRQPDSDRMHQPTTSHPTEEIEQRTPEEVENARAQDGTWGERDVGGFDEAEARDNYEELRRQLTDLGRTRSKDTQGSRLKRTVSGRTRKSEQLSRPGTRQTEHPPAESEAGDIEAAPKEEEADEFELDQFMREGHFEKRTEGASAKKVGVIYKHLNVKGKSCWPWLQTPHESLVLPTSSLAGMGCFEGHDGQSAPKQQSYCSLRDDT